MGANSNPGCTNKKRYFAPFGYNQVFNPGLIIQCSRSAHLFSYNLCVRAYKKRITGIQPVI